MGEKTGTLCGKVATLKFTVANFTDDSDSGRKFPMIRYRLQEHIQWLIKMNINLYVNEVWIERVDNKFRQQFDKVLEKYQATMHRALGTDPSPFLPALLFPPEFLLLLLDFSRLCLSHSILPLPFTHFYYL